MICAANTKNAVTSQDPKFLGTSLQSTSECSFRHSPRELSIVNAKPCLLLTVGYLVTNSHVYSWFGMTKRTDLVFDFSFLWNAWRHHSWLEASKVVENLYPVPCWDWASFQVWEIWAVSMESAEHVQKWLKWHSDLRIGQTKNYEAAKGSESKEEETSWIYNPGTPVRPHQLSLWHPLFGDQ